MSAGLSVPGRVGRAVAAPTGASLPARTWPDRDRAAATRIRTINVGLIGLGHVGQAVARLIPEAGRLRDHGLRFRIAGALVRDLDKLRRCPTPSRVTSNPAAFLRGNFDVVIEALAEPHPARTLVARLLGRGIPVVSCNKALVAAYGTELATLAARRGTSFRYEASALAGVPFLGAFAARPLVSDLRAFTAIVNGTSNYILTALEREQCPFGTALDRARTLGLTEPDPSRDLDGVDAANKLALLASLVGWGPLTTASVDVQGIRDLTPADADAARTLGAAIKPLVHAVRDGRTVHAFVGPALVPFRHPLATLDGTLSGIQLSGRFVPDLFFSGPGAGPDITAATIVDDAVEAVTSAPVLPRAPRRTEDVLLVESPATEWFLRARFPGLVPEPSAVALVFANLNLEVRHVTAARDDARWLRIGADSRAAIDAALVRVQETHRIRAVAIRAV